MAKDRTLRRKLPKKRYYKGGQQIVEFQTILDSYLENLEAKRDQYNEIKSEALNIYDTETSNKNNEFRSLANNILTFLENFYQTVQKNYTTKQDDIKQCISTYGPSYTNKFIVAYATLESVVNEINEQIDVARNINDMFQQKKIHIHLINNYYTMLNTINVNSLNAKFNSMLMKINSIIGSIKNDYVLKQKKDADDTEILEGKQREITQAIGMVNRPIPDGFIPGATTFIQGCPLGSILEGDQCVYYNDLSGNKTLIESVPQQKTLLNLPNSEFIIWFNKINQMALGNPIVFKKKELQYLVPLTPEDAELFNAKYVVAEQNGTPKLDAIFIQDILCCWDQLNTSFSPSGTNYYIDHDAIPQPVKVLEKVAPVMRNNESFTKYVCLLDEIDQILSGIQYIETDISGNVLYNEQPAEPLNIPHVDLSYNVSTYSVGGAQENSEKNIIPFYPDLYNYKLNNNIFTKAAYNGVDEFKYVLLPLVLNPMPNLRPPSAKMDTLSLDPYTYNSIPKLFVNKYLQISIQTYYCPFILQEVLMKSGDYFLIHNTGEIPIIFILSSDEKRIVVYPNEVYCFVYSDLSSKLKYGYLSFEKHTVYSIKSTKVTKLTNNLYVFVDTKALYENGKYIMQTIDPLLDSENNLIIVPNFNSANSTYYDIDDIYETNPIKVEIVESKQVTVNNKTYTSSIKQTSISKEFLPYKSDYVCISNIGNVFVFCDSVGTPLIDVLGYFIPVPTPIFYDGSKTFWFSQTHKKPVTILEKYIKSGTFDSKVEVANQLTTPNVSKYMNTTVYTNKDSIPILGDVNTLVQVVGNNGIMVTPQQQLPSNIQTKVFDISEKQGEINKFTISNKINIYLQTTDLLINYFKDISGSMNNLNTLRGNLLVQYKTLSLSGAKDVYKEVLTTLGKLNIALAKKEQMQQYADDAKNQKDKRINELTHINTSLQSIEKTLKDISGNIKQYNDRALISDYNTLYTTFKNIQQTYTSLNTNLNDITDPIILEGQEKNVSILFNSTNILEQNLVSLQDAIKTKELNKNALLLNEKKAQLEGLKVIIDAEKERLNAYSAQVPVDASDDLKNRFTTSAKIIKSIIDSVDQDTTNNIMITPDLVDKQIKMYNAYIQNIKDEETKIQDVLAAMQSKIISASQSELVNTQNILNKRIMDFEKNHTAILEIPVDKSSHVSDLQDNLIEVQKIKGNLQSISDLDTLQADMKRLDELISMDKEIQTILQTNELMSSEEPVVQEPVLYESESKKPATISTVDQLSEPIIEEIPPEPAQPQIPERLLSKFAGGKRTRKAKKSTHPKTNTRSHRQQ